MADLGLTEHQKAIADRVIHDAERTRRHLVVALSGAHAYGFPSPDSDLDLKAIHVEPTARLLGLSMPEATAERMEVIDGVEIDYSSNELQGVLRGVLAGNGNYAERILGARLLQRSPELDELIPIVQRSLSQRLHRHYLGFATSQLKELAKGPAPTAKRVLYVLRTTLTGAHVLKTGALVADLSLLADEHGFRDAHALIAAKRAGERVPLDEEAAKHWRQRLEDAFAHLESARGKSVLPETSPNQDELETWLIQIRLGSGGQTADRSQGAVS